jgi:hypothetical protein
MTSKRGLQTAESIEQRLGDAVLIRARTPTDGRTPGVAPRRRCSYRPAVLVSY